jgi:NADH:ubiquinone reductase (non-electrogenic)
MAHDRARILIIGGGFGGLFTALELAGACEVTLVSGEDHFLFSPMLYEYLSGEVEAWHIAPHYSELLDEGVNFIHGEVTEIDLDARKASLAGHIDPLTYDVLVLAVGGITNYWNVEGAAEHAMPFRKLAHADNLRQRMIDALDHVPPDFAPQDARRAMTFAIVGAGASGVELATKMSDLLRDAFKRRALHGEPRVMVIEMGDHVVPGMGEEIRVFVEDALAEARVEIHTHTRVLSVRADGLTFEHNGETTEMQAAATVWTGGVRLSPLVEKLDLAKDKRGLILVRPTLQTEKHDNVFALGDIALFEDASPQLAGTAQLALQEAGLLGDNIKALLKGKELKTKHFEEMGEAVSLGTERAAVLTGGKAFGGALARQARFALYTSRLPTWHHRLKVGASWFFEGTQPRPLQPLGLKR